MNGLLAILPAGYLAFSAMAAAPESGGRRQKQCEKQRRREKQRLRPVKVDVNTADVEELTRIPGIGPKTAEAIVAYRKDVGPFKTVEDLIEVKGIGPKKLETIRPFLANI
jgi:competence ComEA-like helix-hairpin-helix protein